MSNFLLYERLCDYKMLKLSYKQTQLAERKYRKEAIIYDMARERNLVELWRELCKETYKPSAYISFRVYEPKERVVNAPRIRDKVVQYAAHVLLSEVYKPVFIQSSFACLLDKGSHRAVDKVQHNMRLCKWQHGTGWIVKLDVRKYFYSINRDILKSLLRKKISDEKFLHLLDIIIDSSPEGERGIPLGNVTSQDFANIYLNEVDQFATRFLGLKSYVRYMDDVIIVVPTKEEAQAILEKLTKFFNEKLDLQLNEKTKIFPLEQGVNAYGFKIHTTHRMVRNSSKAAMKRRIKAMDTKLKAGELSKAKVQQSVDSWLGHARHSNSFNLCKKIFGKYRYIKIEHPRYRFGDKTKST